MYCTLASIGTSVPVVVREPQPPISLLHQVTCHVPQHPPSLPTVTAVPAGTHTPFGGAVWKLLLVERPAEKTPPPLRLQQRFMTTMHVCLSAHKQCFQYAIFQGVQPPQSTTTHAPRLFFLVKRVLSPFAIADGISIQAWIFNLPHVSYI